MRFSGEGPRIFCRTLDAALGEPGAPRAWYLSVVNRMAQCARVTTQPLESLWWEEIDSFADLERVRRSLAWIGDRRLGFDPSSAPRAAAGAGTRDRSEACESAC